MEQRNNKSNKSLKKQDGGFRLFKRKSYFNP